MGNRSKLLCTVTSCPNQRRRPGGLCSTHYRRAVKAGDVAHVQPKCPVAGCTDRKHEALAADPGYCMKHHRRVQRTGSVDEPRPQVRPWRGCSVDGCPERHSCVGLCAKHYLRWMRYGTVDLGASTSPTYTCIECDETFEHESNFGGRRVRCPEHVHLGRREARARWVAANPDLARQLALDHGSRRRAMMRQAPFEFVDRLAVFERDEWTCQLCGWRVDPSTRGPDPRTASLDHIVPLSKGGSHTYANTQLACLICNIRKNATMPDGAAVTA